MESVQATGSGSTQTPLHVLMIGCGEYTVGLPPSDGQETTGNGTDKSMGVVALCLLDLRRVGTVGWLSLCGTSHRRVQRAQAWLRNGAGSVYGDLETELDALYPPSEKQDGPEAYKHAIDQLKPGVSAVTIFTPDHTHWEIAMYAIQRKVHVLLAKPAVHTVQQHLELVRAAQEHGVLVAVDFHKRFDPMYGDAADRIAQSLATVGDVGVSDLGSRFNYFYAYMSQPKYQLVTFRRWAGKSSDISYYLNAHHVDFLTWSLGDHYVPVQVCASASRGIASSATYSCVPDTEDTITLVVQFQQTSTGELGTAVFTASWTAPDRAECHSQQRFHYLGSRGEIRMDQARRGYELVTDQHGFQSKNPLFMNYTPDRLYGRFQGSRCYGYQSFAVFVKACQCWGSDEEKFPAGLATLASTLAVTAILEAGRQSLTSQGAPVAVNLAQKF